MRIIRNIILCAFFGTLSAQVTSQNYFQADWESLKQQTVPDWFKDAKFGIFIHWGPYAVPAYAGDSYGEWYPYNMYRKGTAEYKHHIKTYGPLDKFGY